MCIEFLAGKWACTFKSVALYKHLYAREKYIMHFLEAARFLNALVLAGHKVNVLYNPGLAERPPPTPLTTQHQGREEFGP